MKLVSLILLSTLIVLPFSSIAKQVRTVELTAKNTVVFSEDIDEVSVDTVMSAILAKRVMFNDEDETIYLLITSAGGEYNATLTLENFIASVPNLQVICKYCASAAGYLFATYKNHNRLAIDKSQMVMHELYSPRFTARMAKSPNIIRDLIASSEAFNSKIRAVLGMSKEDYEKKIEDRNWIVTGKDLVKLKLASELVKITCDKYMEKLAPDTCR